jgi:hypothetical protein
LEWKAKWKSKINYWKFKAEFKQSFLCKEWGNDEGCRIYKEKKLKLNFPIIGYFIGQKSDKVHYSMKQEQIYISYNNGDTSFGSSWTKKILKQAIKNGNFIVTSSGEHIEE